MALLNELFSDWVGVLSFGVIAFILVMAVYFTWYFIRHMVDDEARTGARPPGV